MSRASRAELRAKWRRRNNRVMGSLPMEALELLQAYDFPGNLRKLEAMLYEAVTRHREGLLPLRFFKDWLTAATDALPGQPAPADVAGALEHCRQLPTIKGLTCDLVSEAMRRADGRQSTAVQWLGISEAALSKRLSRAACTGSSRLNQAGQL